MLQNRFTPQRNAYSHANGIPIPIRPDYLFTSQRNVHSHRPEYPRLVNDHDFRSDSTGVAIPYGIYDLLANRGSVMVGVSHDTSAFAAHAIAHWWQQEGAVRYPRSRQLLILSDTGVSVW